tara:strand:- start:159 stop:749 length:591 start_codon:yes stop_codon:yes gene_type:complete
MTLIESYTQIFHRKYVYPTDENKNEEFFVKMNKHFEELCEIDKTRAKKVKEIEEYLETIDFNFGDVDYQDEIDYEEPFQEVKIGGKNLKYNKNNNMPSKYEWWNKGWEYDDLVKTKMDNKMEEKDWYVTFFQVDEGNVELEIDEDFNQDKLKWDGECMKYGDEYLSDEGGTKPNSDVDTTCEYENDETDTYFSHTW